MGPSQHVQNLRARMYSQACCGEGARGARGAGGTARDQLRAQGSAPLAPPPCSILTPQLTIGMLYTNPAVGQNVSTAYSFSSWGVGMCSVALCGMRTSCSPALMSVRATTPRSPPSSK